MIAKKLRRLLLSDPYVPGLISLLLVLPLSMYRLLYHPALNKQYTLEVNYYSPTDHRPEPVLFPPAREYLAIDIDGNITQDESQLRDARIMITQMLHRKDTIRGLKIHFGAAARYESFVTAIDICSADSALTYTPYKDELWVYLSNSHSQQEKSPYLYLCGTMPAIKQLSESDLFPQRFPFAYYAINFWPSALLLMMMGAASFWRTRKL